MKKEDAAKKLIEEQENLKKLQEEMQINTLGLPEPTSMDKNLDTNVDQQQLKIN